MVFRSEFIASALSRLGVAAIFLVRDKWFAKFLKVFVYSIQGLSSSTLEHSHVVWPQLSKKPPAPQLVTNPDRSVTTSGVAQCPSTTQCVICENNVRRAMDRLDYGFSFALIFSLL